MANGIQNTIMRWAMTQDRAEFSIDDAVGTDANLASFAERLEVIDVQLGASLRPFLTQMANVHLTDIEAIWDQLYAATKVQPPPAKSQDTDSGERS